MKNLDNYRSILIVILIVLLLLLGYDWLYYTQLFDIPTKSDLVEFGLFKIIQKTHSKITMLRVYFIVLSLGFAYITNYQFKVKEIWFNLISLLIIAAFIGLGYQSFSYYNLFVYPVLLVLSPLASINLINFFNSKVLDDQEIFGLNKDKNKNSYFLETEKGTLHIPNPEQHFYIEGGTGAGKGGSVIHPLLYQNILQRKPGIVYNYKGYDSMLTKTSCLAFDHLIDKTSEKDRHTLPQLRLINFEDMSRTFGYNLLDPKKLTTPLEVGTLTDNVLTALNPHWAKKGKNEWSEWSITYLQSIIWKLVEDYPEKCTWPLLTEILTSKEINFETLNNFIDSNKIASKMFQSVRASSGSEKQLAGIVSTAIGGFKNMVSKEIYWVLSQDNTNLLCNTKEDPQVVILSSRRKIQQSLNPIISASIGQFMSLSDQSDLLPGFLSLDEIYSIYLADLPGYANIIREREISIQIGNQDIDQLYDLYGENKGNAIIAAGGNKFYGMSGTNKSAKYASEMFSDIDQVNFSYGKSSDNLNENESFRRVKALQVRDMAGLARGEFVGKIANGLPPFFRENFKLFDFEKKAKSLEIPPFVLDSGVSEEELKKSVELNYKDVEARANDIITDYVVAKKIK